jgi:hypothetical protein
VGIQWHHHPPRGRWDSRCQWSSDPDTSCIRRTIDGHRRIRSNDRSGATFSTGMVQVRPSAVHTASVVIGGISQASKILVEAKASWAPVVRTRRGGSTSQCDHYSLVIAVRARVATEANLSRHLAGAHTLSVCHGSRSVFDCAHNGRSKDHISHPSDHPQQLQQLEHLYPCAVLNWRQVPR